jgi:hypothetical protein
VDRGKQGTANQKEPTVIFANTLPGFKVLLSLACLPVHIARHATSFVAAFVLHRGTMSCTQAATIFRHRQCNVATLTRFLCAIHHSSDLLVCVRSAALMLEAELSQPGEFLFLLDATKRHSQGRFLENSYSCGNTKRTPRKDRKGKGQRKQYKRRPSRCHSFICGLLLTPGGLRLPYCLSYYTKEYCSLIAHPFHTDSELAARLILDLQLPADARVVVVGDTAYDAEVIQKACGKRNFRWIVPANPERVLAGKNHARFQLTTEALAKLHGKGVPQDVLAKLALLKDRGFAREPFVEALGAALSKDEVKQFQPMLLKHSKENRRKVQALQEDLNERSFEPVRLSLDCGPNCQQRRVSASRGGPGKNPKRTYWVHRRAEDVQSVGMVVLLFSKKTQVKPGAEKGKADKILMSNAFEATTEQLVAWYDLRWQIELFFKECKSVLGLDHYRVGKFCQVEGWVELCLVAFCYLEWFRAKELLRSDLSREQRQFWSRARTHDLCQLVRQRIEEEEVERMCAMMETSEGRRQLAAGLRAACVAATGASKAA